MKLDYKKIIVTLVILITLGIIVYFLWQGIAGPPIVENQPLSSTSSTSNLPSGLPPASSTSSPQIPGGSSIVYGTSSPAIIKVSDQPAEAYWIDGQTAGIFYLNQNGQVFLVNKNVGAKDTQITQQNMGSIDSVAVGPDSQRVLASFGSPRAPQWAVFDDADQVWRPLPSTVINATWGKDSATFYGIVQNGSVPALASIDTSNGNPVIKILIKDFRFQDVELAFLPPSSLLLIEKASVDYPSRVWRLNTNTLAINLLLDNQKGLLFEPSSDKRVIFTFRGGVFQILDSTTLGQITPIPFITIPEKCTLSGVISYCFVPNSQAFKTANLPDDYLMSRVFTSDELFEMDMSGNIAFAAIPTLLNNGIFDGINPVFNNGFLYFRNRLDNYVYALNLTSDQFSQNGQSVGN